MSLDPSFVGQTPPELVTSTPGVPPSGPAMCALPAGQITAGQITAGQITTDLAAGSPRVTRAEVLTLAAGDRLIVHVDGAAGMSAAGAEQAGHKVRALLALDELPFDVPVLVVSPGIRVTVARPT